METSTDVRTHPTSIGAQLGGYVRHSITMGCSTSTMCGQTSLRHHLLSRIHRRDFMPTPSPTSRRDGGHRVPPTRRLALQRHTHLLRRPSPDHPVHPHVDSPRRN
eukprot:1123872-Prymnesium_polylepis.1